MVFCGESWYKNVIAFLLADSLKRFLEKRFLEIKLLLSLRHITIFTDCMKHVFKPNFIFAEIWRYERNTKRHSFLNVKSFMTKD